MNAEIQNCTNRENTRAAASVETSVETTTTRTAMKNPGLMLALFAAPGFAQLIRFDAERRPGKGTAHEGPAIPLPVVHAAHRSRRDRSESCT
jgi:hypothetical protein